MTPSLAFDIETVPDISGIRRLHDLAPDLSDAQVAEFAFARRREATGHDFLPLHLQRVLVISCALREGDGFRVWSLEADTDPEACAIQRFYDGLEKYTPQLISWNGGGFDLPVLHYRGMLNCVSAPRYWELGDDDREFRYNNYLNRYHLRHLDLMDTLALYQARANVPLDEFAKLLGFPGKLGMAGNMVWPAYQAGQFQDIRRYCETDVVNTHLVFLRFQHMRGLLDRKETEREEQLVREMLGRSDEPHWVDFLRAWAAA